MKIYDRQNFKYTYNNNNYYIYCYLWDKSNSWGHNATIFDDFNEIANDNTRYYNRTWEQYTYQSVILSAISNAIEQRKTRLIYNYKYYNNKKRLTKEQKKEIIKDDEKLSILQTMYNHFQNDTYKKIRYNA